MTNRKKIKGEQNLRYNLKVWQKNDAFDILNNVSEFIPLVQLMDSLGNVNYLTPAIINHCVRHKNNWI